MYNLPPVSRHPRRRRILAVEDMSRHRMPPLRCLRLSLVSGLYKQYTEGPGPYTPVSPRPATTVTTPTGGCLVWGSVRTLPQTSPASELATTLQAASFRSSALRRYRRATTICGQAVLWTASRSESTKRRSTIDVPEGDFRTRFEARVFRAH